ncbi:hypothetical protein SAMN05444064_11524 [Pseudomonas syringae]|nr:hypothetical protein SAMN05444514_11424 [Pseudomonas syringae]SFM35959.1 hypothetical protein SAMN05444064_11524 [Pseudomonas syringae]
MRQETIIRLRDVACTPRKMKRLNIMELWTPRNSLKK